MSVAVAFLLQADDGSRARIVGLVFAAVVAWFLTLSINRMRRERAMQTDDFVETAREVSMPSRCASCGASEASQRIAVKRGFVFSFCDRCARSMRWRAPLRGLARFLVVVLILHVVLFFSMRFDRVSVFVMELATKRGMAASKVISILWFDMIVAAFLLAPLVWLLAPAPAVRVDEQGEERVRFRFANDAYRNEFEEMNR
ncbi:MAG TPA: hypothetical protein VJZ00_17250 [Thermoanaerobaculia bacterium]|nr:hypothetical protein [Thermoanaerobaculia bacterium]